MFRSLPLMRLWDGFDVSAHCGGVAYVAAIGFEDRSLAFAPEILSSGALDHVVCIKYVNRKANRVAEFNALLSKSSATKHNISYNSDDAAIFEARVDLAIRDILSINPNCLFIVDISAASKLIILVVLLQLMRLDCRFKVLFATASSYGPSRKSFEARINEKGDFITSFAMQPSHSVSEIVRTPCLSSVRMQGRPICAVAFTSFNEQLVRHCIGTVSPQRLILINGSPPRDEDKWRARATNIIHSRLAWEYREDNPVDEDTSLLKRTISTLNYLDGLFCLGRIYRQYSPVERVMVFATGSKMQTVSLALLKHAHEDVHIEYPTPESYHFQEYSTGVGARYSVDFSSLVAGFWGGLDAYIDSL